MLETFDYDPRLKEAATKFMLSIFDNPKLSNETSNIAVEAAMNIINGATFYQPKHNEND